MALGRRGRVRAALIGGSGAAGPARGDNVGWARGSGAGAGTAREQRGPWESTGMNSATRSEKPRDRGYRHRRLGPRRDSSGTKGSSELLIQGERVREGRRESWRGIVLESVNRPNKHTERRSDKMPDGADVYK